MSSPSELRLVKDLLRKDLLPLLDEPISSYDSFLFLEQRLIISEERP